MHVHLVFVAKYRRKVFTPAVIATLQTVFAKICEDFEAALVECDGDYDHVHLLINYPPKTSVSRLVNSLKGASSRRLNQTPRTEEILLEGDSLVSQLLRRQLRRSTHLYYPAVHRKSITATTRLISPP